MFKLNWTNRFVYRFNSHFLTRCTASLSYFRWENLHTFWLFYVLGIQCHVLYLFTCIPEVKLPHWEPVATLFLSQPDRYDEMFSTVLILSSITLLYSFHTIHFTPFADLAVGRIMYDLTVVNVEHYRASLPPKPFHNLSSLLTILSKPRNALLNWHKFSNTRLPHLINLELSPKTRLKLAHLQTLVEMIISVGHYFFLCTYIIFITAYYEPITRPYYKNADFWIIYMPIFLLNFIIIFAYLLYMARVFFLVFSFSLLISQLYITHLSQLNQNLLFLIRRINHSRCAKLGVTSHFLVRHFIRQHVITCYQVLCINRQLIARIILCFVGFNIPANIFLVTRILFKPFSQIEKSFLALILVYQVTSFGAMLFPFAVLHKKLHSSKHFLVPIQQALYRVHFITKLKLDSLQCRLNHGRKYGMTVGPLTTVSHYSIFEMLIVYVGYFIFMLTHKL